MKKSSLFVSFLLDILAAAFLLLLFAFIHHGYAWLKVQLAEKNTSDTSAQSIQEVSPEPASELSESGQSDAAASDPSAAAAETEADSSGSGIDESEPATEEVSTVTDTRTEWQKKFEDHFTDEVVITENSYSSPNVSVTVTTYHTSDEELAAGSKRVTYYVADIYIASVDCFRRCIANNRFEQYTNQPADLMDQNSNAIVGMTGDFFSVQYDGMEVVNGVVERSDYTTSDICVLNYDGTIETLSQGEYDPDTLLNSGNVWNLWHFGPKLLTEDGEVPEEINASYSINYTNPRSALGYYEPGHYCFVVVDGRQGGWSDGLTLTELAELFHDLGCSAAYNLDGGGSAVLTFNDTIYSRQVDDRTLSDLLIICEPESAEIPDNNGGANE